MKRTLRMTTIVACAVLFLGTIAAQGQKKVKKSDGGAVTISGCLQKGAEADTYVLTNVPGGGPYELIGAPASVNFAPHVGHRIEVTGKNITKPNKAAKIEGAKGAAKKEERGERHLEVQSMKMVSPTCPSATSSSARHSSVNRRLQNVSQTKVDSRQLATTLLDSKIVSNRSRIKPLRTRTRAPSPT